MPVKLKKFGVLNDSRINRLLLDKKTATHMGIWDKFKDVFRGAMGTSKQEQLNKLWEELHPNAPTKTDVKNKNCDDINLFETKNEAIEKFITFTKLKDLADDGHKDKFTVNLETNLVNGFVETDLTFAINNHIVTQSNNLTELNRRVISAFIDFKTGMINDNTDITSIEKKAQVINNSATKVQANFRGFRQRLKNQKPDEFGMKTIKYEKKGKPEEIYKFTSNNVGHFIPQRDQSQPESGGEHGTFKVVVKKERGNILFKQTTRAKTLKKKKPAFTSHQIEQIFKDFGIESGVVTHKFSATEYIAHDAGENDLFIDMSKKKTHKPYYFKQLLKDMKTLHQAQYYHLDIKPDNIQINNQKGRPVLIDWDDFSSSEQVIEFAGAPKYSCHELYWQNYINHDKTAIAKSLQTADEFALALTLMSAENYEFACGLNFIYKKAHEQNKAKPQVSPAGWISGKYKLPKTEKFIEKYIKPEYHEAFKMLIYNPYEYFTRGFKIHLFDMFKDFEK